MGNALASEAFKRNLKAQKIPDTAESRELSALLLRSDLQGFAALAFGVYTTPKAISLGVRLFPRKASAVNSGCWVLFIALVSRAARLPARAEFLLAKLNGGQERTGETVERTVGSPYLYPAQTSQTYVYGLPAAFFPTRLDN